MVDFSEGCGGVDGAPCCLDRQGVGGAIASSVTGWCNRGRAHQGATEEEDRIRGVGAKYGALPHGILDFRGSDFLQGPLGACVREISLH